MKISRQTIDECAAKGISVRWYAEPTYDEFKRNQWAMEYERWFNYSKNSCKELNPPRNDGSFQCWNFETLAEYEEDVRKFCDRIIDRHCDPYDYTTLYITYDNGQKTIVKKESVKSKEITTDMVLKLVAKQEKAYKGYYGQFALDMQRLLNKHGISGEFAIYPTTYGIGVWVFYNFNAKNHIEQVTNILKERGVEYYNEYSDAGFVYRFKVSKAKENLAKVA